MKQQTNNLQSTSAQALTSFPENPQLYIFAYTITDIRPKKKNMCVYGHPTHPIFQLPTLTFFISNYSILIFSNDPINFYTEFGLPFVLFNQQQCFIYSTASFLSKLRAKKVEKLCKSS
jgi:hypothetical protein